MLPFLIRPWDRPRPRLHPPLPNSVHEFGGKTYETRERHGLTFVRESGRSDEWLLAFDASYRGDFEGEMRRGRMARFVLLPFQAETWRREFPLFFRPDGTGWLRESWNREDIEFEHGLSLHGWLESPASAVFPFAAELFKREIAPKLEELNWPKGRDLAIEFAGGTKAQLQTIVGYALALEEAVRGSRKLIRATFQTESPFFRAGVFIVKAERGEVETWFDERDGERVRLPWERPALGLSNRFWQLCDFAVNQITPLGYYFDFNDKGAGRLSESPQPHQFSLQFIADKLPSSDEARVWLQDWLLQSGADASLLNDEEIAEFEARSRD